MFQPLILTALLGYGLSNDSSLNKIGFQECHPKPIGSIIIDHPAIEAFNLRFCESVANREKINEFHGQMFADTTKQQNPS